MANDTVENLFSLAQSSARSHTGNEGVSGGSDAETFLTAVRDINRRPAKDTGNSGETSNDVTSDAVDQSQQNAERAQEVNKEGWLYVGSLNTLPSFPIVKPKKKKMAVIA